MISVLPDNWSSDCPKEAGDYWFYGDPYKGQMGIDYRDECPPVEAKLYFVEISAISNGLIGTSEGQIISLSRFDKTKRHEGVVGYWQKAETPALPVDVEGLFV